MAPKPETERVAMAKSTTRLTVDDVRRYLNINRPQLTRLILHKKDPLPFTMTRRDLNAYIDRHTVPARRKP
jgi:hypothetical protein